MYQHYNFDLKETFNEKDGAGWQASRVIGYWSITHIQQL